MQTELNFFLLVFILLLVILLIIYPVSGIRGIKELRRKYAEGQAYSRISFYKSSMFASWLVVFLILLLIPISGVSLDDLGMKWFYPRRSSLSGWILYPGIVLYLLHLGQNLYYIRIFRSKSEKRKKLAGGIAEDFKFFLPITAKEKQVWNYLSLSAGITEEIIYRGYMFFALAVIFPSLHLVYILLLSTLIFGVGHLYLGKEVLKSTFLGLLFGIYYIVFDSLYPVMLIHTVQDLVVRDILQEEETDGSL